MGEGCIERSRDVAKWFAATAELLGCHFMDAEGCEFNSIDFMHLSRKGHEELAQRLAKLVPTLV